MDPTHRTVTVMEQCRVAPPAEAAPHQYSLELTFLDIVWIVLPPVQRLVFYRHPISSSDFLLSLIPNLKLSLIRALRLFFPLAGRLITPTDSDLPGCRPAIRYVAGDSVSLTFAETAADFQSLTENHSKPADQLHPLVPELPAATDDDVAVDSSSGMAVLAIQVTLFPNTGFSIGISNLHAVGDASSIFNFVSSWAYFSRFDGDTEPPPYDLLPLFDRDVIEDPDELWLKLLRRIQQFLRMKPWKLLAPPKDKVRATFTFDGAQIQKLKQAVSSKRPAPRLASTFAVACGYVWSCIVKSCSSSEDDDGDEEFGFPGDYRGRSNPSIPTNYFGNCLKMGKALAKASQLTAEDGFATAADLIRGAVRQTMYGEKGLLEDAENWFSLEGSAKWGRVVGVAGSPRFNYYDLDFGWGKACKFEVVSIDLTGAISLSGGRQSGDGSVEVGLSLPGSQMDAFASIFTDLLARL